MKKHPWLCFFIIMLVVGLVVGISATDLWQYIVDFMKIGVDLLIKWLNEVINAIRDSLTSVTGTNNSTSLPTSMEAAQIMGVIRFS